MTSMNYAEDGRCRHNTCASASPTHLLSLRLIIVAQCTRSRLTCWTRAASTPPVLQNSHSCRCELCRLPTASRASMGCSESKWAMPNMNDNSAGINPTAKRELELMCDVEILNRAIRESEKEIVRHFWAVIAQDLVQNGVSVFKRLFTMYPEIKNYFKALTMERSVFQRNDSDSLEQHAVAVMSVIDEVVHNVDNLEVAEEKLIRVGKFHRCFEDFSAATFWYIKVPFLETVKIVVGEEWSDDVDAAFKWFICFILFNLSKGFDGVKHNGIID